MAWIIIMQIFCFWILSGFEKLERGWEIQIQVDGEGPILERDSATAGNRTEIFSQVWLDGNPDFMV